MTPLTVAITEEGSSTHGHAFTLTCSVTTVSGLQANVDIIWSGKNGEIIASEGRISVGSPVAAGDTTNLTLHFDSLKSADEGEYYCTAIATLPPQFPSQNASSSTIIHVNPGTGTARVHSYTM